MDLVRQEEDRENTQSQENKVCDGFGEGQSGWQNSEQKVLKEKDGSLKGCHSKKCLVCDEQMETKDRSKGREEIKMADHQICLSKRT